MKKGEEYICVIDRVDYPNRGIASIDGNKVAIKNALEGQTVRIKINKKRTDKIEARLIEIIEKSKYEVNETCSVFGICGGCLNQSFQYEKQLQIKEQQVVRLLKELGVSYDLKPIVGSPEIYGYRNKMEFTFGDEVINGPLALGMHRRNSHHDLVNMVDCKLCHYDYNVIAMAVKAYFTSLDIPYYHQMRHEGFLRHLSIRHSKIHNQLMINLVTSSQRELDDISFVEKLLSLPLENQIRTIIHTTNDNLADAIKPDTIDVLYGSDYLEESLLGLKFKVSPFSFFQTNTYGAEKLYEVVRNFVGDTKDQVVFDLYSGTGTIAQLVASVAKKAVGVEIIEEAVIAARENAALNGLTNCEFIAGDVLSVLDQLTDKPDIIILDPPREGIHPKALPKIIGYGVEKIVYVSCKPTTLVKDLMVFLKNGYKLEKVQCVDMFPHTGHVECVVKLEKR